MLGIVIFKIYFPIYKIKLVESKKLKTLCKKYKLNIKYT